MDEFLKFFDSVGHNFPMHLDIGYNKTCDWIIRVYRKGYMADGSDLEILFEQGCDMELCFAKAQVELKEWLSENNGGY